MHDFPGAACVRRSLEGGEMEAKVIIYGTETCPFCKKAREAYGDRAIFYNVSEDPERLKEMLVYSKGDQRVPVIVEAGAEAEGGPLASDPLVRATVSIGYGGT
jgi:glutaredoxin 3